ncbi:tRNA (adenosine(37)-N6)-threonylcarbamoyltransferase complex dimerization subunit type 1 TsaB [Stenomitos frigidus]|uniref:tRNA (Adenosine(37)-N6)-threonylcarbamoyltransferase complex dimerization subunit type 1 TsaB n=1 Tax=Stenomitos frigidus ULC18 TaxID=2107698 RepID=A0A2T1EGL8_9CYAN|nr:tRNA (adenosine(37)-N6)-threonylcarbamoyltransferase complex dimerization subunit type 1 TsaB [Stenomitos frigidus]PSB31854.1 tRNA (adenosine(37)-N6)-threonylcarbamoyltransferase complex dimerization subunit type 1 TsaB [Stenomitos frigidus ULC18]
MKLDSTQYGLAIHTASPDLGLAIDNFAGDDRAQVWPLGRDLSTHLHVHLADFLQPQTWTDLAFIAVAKGPGGFTGTRLGVVTARTLAQQLNMPLFAVSTLAALAHASLANGAAPDGQSHIAVQMPAQRGEVFGAIYQLSPAGLHTLLPDSVLSLATWQQTLTDWTAPYQLIQADGGLGSTVFSVLALAHEHWQQGLRPHWSEALPFYGQHPVTM